MAEADELFSVRDRVVLVSGGSRGIGRGLAEGFAARGARVVIAGREEATLRQAASEIGGSAWTCDYVVCDVSQPDDVPRLIESVVAKATPLELAQPLDKRIIYYLNDGIYGSFNCIYFDHSVPTILPFNERDGGQYMSTIFGPTCDSIDLICENAMLPDLAIGEWVYVEDFGAYTAASSSAFNGFKTNSFKYIFTS